ncbi:thioester reductase domain-containing protein, partial [Paenibacillus sepulcri]|nr:thioester reductase domain-containing protein [Paenibacillus sepulcri]
LAAKDGTPMTDKEHLIIEAYKEVTGVKNITLYDDFFELGGSSLSAVNVVSRLQKDLRISIRQLFEYPRASDLARHIGFKTEDSFLPKDELKRYLLARRDRYLSPADADNEWEAKRLLYEERSRGYNATSLTRRVEYKDILLTGSTGYLGIYLLYELLRHSSSNVHLIIRSGSREEAVNRIKEKLRFYFGPDFYEEWNRRIFVYNGDLTKKNLGMDDRGYRDLCGLVPCIIHSAANVSHYGKYDESYEANIVATDNLIEFALTGRIKDFNHISTMAVASGRVEHQKDILFTEFDCDVGQAMTSPYSKTKLIAEKRLMEARQKGVDVTIFRVGNIVFDSRSGKFQENIAQNALYSLIQSYVTIGLIPEMERDTDFSCVDDVSRAIVSLFDRMELKNETHHIYNPSPVSMSELLTMPGLALGVEQASIERFLDYVYDENQVRGHSSPIYNIQLHSIGDEWGELDSPADHTLFHVRSDKTAALLERTGFVWKEMNEQLAGRMVDYCRQVKFL